jgi:hypothetical protein
MVPMIDIVAIPGSAAAALAVSPAGVVLLVVVVAGLAWIVRGANEELRRQAAREHEARALRVPGGAPRGRAVRPAVAA